MSTARHNVWVVSSLMLGVMVLSGCATQQAATPAQPAAAVGDPVQVYAAGSLRDALTEIARDPLCALAQGEVAVTSDTLVSTMLQPQVRLGISTPKVDPAGDYAWALFHKADALQPGATARLEAKALQLTGGAQSAQAPAGRNTYAWVMEQNRADVFLTYCTNAVAARAEVPSLQVVAVPEALQVGAAYGLTVRAGAPAQAQAFAQAVLQPPAQAVFRRLGFAAP